MKKIIVGLVVSMMILPNFASASSISELQAQIAVLLKQVEQLQQQLAQKTQTSSGPLWCPAFEGNLTKGNSGDHVKYLQTALSKSGIPITINSLFDNQTVSAVKKFQEKYKGDILTPNGLTVGSGYVGPSTRAKLNALYGCNSSQNSTATQTTSTKPDIIISGVACEPSNPKINETIICSITVQNYSSVDITKSFYVSTQGVTKVTVDGLKAWEKKTIKPTSGISFDSVGSKQLNFLADIFNSIDESNKNNNSYTMNINVGSISQTNTINQTTTQNTQTTNTVPKLTNSQENNRVDYFFQMYVNARKQNDLNKLVSIFGYDADQVKNFTDTEGYWNYSKYTLYKAIVITETGDTKHTKAYYVVPDKIDPTKSNEFIVYGDYNMSKDTAFVSQWQVFPSISSPKAFTTQSDIEKDMELSISWSLKP